MDLAPYYEKYGWNGKFAPWVIDRIKSDGKVYGVPFHALGMGFWYRRTSWSKMAGRCPPPLPSKKSSAQP